MIFNRFLQIFAVNSARKLQFFLQEAGGEKGSMSQDMASRRFGIRQKEQVILRLLRGEPLERLADEAGVTQDTLLDLKRRFVNAGREALKNRRRHPQKIATV